MLFTDRAMNWVHFPGKGVYCYIEYSYIVTLKYNEAVSKRTVSFMLTEIA